MQTVDWTRSAMVYALLALFVGGLGVHKFYAHKTGTGVAMLLMGTIGWLLIIPGIAVWIWAFVDLSSGCATWTHRKSCLNKKRPVGRFSA